VIEPRKLYMQEPLPWTLWGPCRRIEAGLMPPVLPGSENRARAQWGFPRNVGDPVVSINTNPAGDTG
jgi:hypothetical protein